MQEFSNTRYSRKVQILYQLTSEVSQDCVTRKPMLDSQYTSTRFNRILPRIAVQNRHLKSTSPELDREELREKTEKGCKREPKNVLNLTKISFREHPKQKQNCKSRYSVLTKQGKRPYNEDRFLCQPKLHSPYPHFHQNNESYALYAVFDGHGGSHCAQFLKQNFSLLLSRSRVLQTNPQQALKQTFLKIQQKYLTLCESRTPLQTSGSCAVACLLSEQKLHVANLGDSRAILLSEEGYLVLTQDHKPQEQGEKMRILKSGGKIYREHQHNQHNLKMFKQMRIFPGNLNVSRTLGDAQVKIKKFGGLPGMISSVPDVCSFETGSYQALLLATDGLFEAFSNQEINSRFVKSQKETSGKKFIEQLCEEAEKRSSDNITVILVELL